MRYMYMLFVALAMWMTATAQQVNYDALMCSYGLVDIKELCDDVVVELKYSTEDNFVGRDMYGELERAYLEKGFAKRVVRAAEILHKRDSSLHIVIYDAARPISIQRAMRREVEGTHLESFVADDSRGGRHNYGVAVDLTLATANGTPLDMGAMFDEFSDASAVKGTPDTSDGRDRTMESYRRYAYEQVCEGVITQRQADNRLLLIEVMFEAGLVPYRREWWHYEELMPMSEVRTKYRLLDF